MKWPKQLLQQGPKMKKELKKIKSDSSDLQNKFTLNLQLWKMEMDFYKCLMKSFSRLCVHTTIQKDKTNKIISKKTRRK